jgi:hypothetical protein
MGIVYMSLIIGVKHDVFLQYQLASFRPDTDLAEALVVARTQQLILRVLAADRVAHF